MNEPVGYTLVGNIHSPVCLNMTSTTKDVFTVVQTNHPICNLVFELFLWNMDSGYGFEIFFLACITVNHFD
jgi:hypothetical protein